MHFPDEASDEVITRLRRAEGQIRGVQRLLGMRHCLADPDGAEAEGMDVDQMEKLFLSLR